MSLADAKPLDSWGSVDPSPARFAWLTIDYPIHVASLPGFADMHVENAETGELWLVPGMQSEEPVVERETRRWAAC